MDHGKSNGQHPSGVGLRRMIWYVLINNWIYVDVRWLGSRLPHHLHGERSGQGEDVNLNRMSF